MKIKCLTKKAALMGCLLGVFGAGSIAMAGQKFTRLQPILAILQVIWRMQEILRAPLKGWRFRITARTCI
jgi:hypothetical protein